MDEIINYVMNTPGNTNPNILRGMLENNNNSESLIVNLEFTTDGKRDFYPNGLKSNILVSDCITALDEGKNVVLKFDGDPEDEGASRYGIGKMTIFLNGYYYSPGETRIIFLYSERLHYACGNLENITSDDDGYIYWEIYKD